jgi:hypothetical protein
MADPILIPCLVQLRDEFNLIAPARSKASDGWIGDTAHQQETSDHNDDEVGRVPIRDADSKHEVHAVDVTAPITGAELRYPPTGATHVSGMEAVVQFLLSRCRSGAEKRLRYMIYNRRIWEASNGWRQRAYTGPSPHTEHAHFSASYTTSLEASTASWHLEDIPVALTADDKKWLSAEIAKAVTAANAARAATGDIPADVWAHREKRVDPKPGQSVDVSMGAIQVFAEDNLKKAVAEIIAALKAPAEQ